MMRTSCFTAALVAALLATTATHATTYYVKPDGNDTATGTSWATARKTIQAAINLAVNTGDEVVVTNGTYGVISVTDNRLITIRSVNGADVTIIDGNNANRCATLGSDYWNDTHTNTVLVGFTLQNGYTTDSGGGAYCGTLNNCTLSGNTASSGGGGATYGTLNNCTLSGNTAEDNDCGHNYGGGASYCTLNNCTLTGNSAMGSGGGAHDCTLNNCSLTGNTASSGGGGAGYGTLNNCMLSGNSAASWGGGAWRGTLNNCTLSGNTASSGGGATESTLNNCIVWGNVDTSGIGDNYYGSIFTNSCTTPKPRDGTGNISTDPCFRFPEVGDFRLTAGSPCLNTGNNGYAIGATDVLGNPRIQNGTVDMGAYEGMWTLRTGAADLARNLQGTTGRADGILISWDAPSSGGAVLYRVCRLDAATGQWEPVSGWTAERSFLDTQVYGGVDYTYAVATAFDVKLDTLSALSQTATGRRISVVYYVAASRPNDSGDGRSWATAKKTIQGAVDVALTWEEIVVTNGVYAPISTANKAITIRSVNGADVTIIDGGGISRCATLGSYQNENATVLTGFILQNGYAEPDGIDDYSGRGGGALGGTLNNCKLTSNTAGEYGWLFSGLGGGACDSILNNCTLTGNTAPSGGGAFGGILNGCTLTGNTAEWGGGFSTAFASGTLNNCILLGNTAEYGGGGVDGGAWGYYDSDGYFVVDEYDCILNNCILSGNTANMGGGAYQCMLNDCTLTGNMAEQGGGTCNGMLNNCTLSGNTAYGDGGAAYCYWYDGGCTLNDCTLTGNKAYEYGGGACGGMLNNCTLMSNTAEYGGGTCDSYLSNCVLTGNEAYEYGGGTCGGELYSCTLSGNTAAYGGGGVYGCYLVNSIVWGNNSGGFTVDNYLECEFDYSCTMPLSEDGTGNISADPLFRLPEAGDFRLTAGSPCLNAGNNDDVASSTDILGNPRIQNGKVDMGAYEGAGALYTGAADLARNLQATTDRTDGVLVSWDAPSAGGTVLYRVCRLDAVTGHWEPVSGWTAETSFLDTQMYGGAEHTYSVVAAFDVNLDALSALSQTVMGRRGASTIYYVAASRPDDSGDGRSWATAKKTIQGAVSVAPAWNEIVVTNGVYAPISTANKTVIIRSVNGAEVTIIDGGGAHRCAILGFSRSQTRTVLTGFTLQNGMPRRDSAYFPEYGGGSYGGTLNNCVLSGNTAKYGGGAYGGTLNNCTLTGNMADEYGGGASDCVLNNCTLTGNMASRGGGVGCFEVCKDGYGEDGYFEVCYYSCTLNNCVLSDNIADYGGGVYGGALSNCTLVGNMASEGGGAYECTLYDCTFSDNTATDNGGGASGCTLYGCTLTGNTITGWMGCNGGGAYECALYGCTLTGNMITGWSGDGGGACECALYDCTLTGNTITGWGDGGGAYECTLDNCTLSGNIASDGDGGGACGGTLNNCILTGNKAYYGGGVCGGWLNNCILTGNTASEGGGAVDCTLNNCTLSGNTAARHWEVFWGWDGGYGGGTVDCTLNNCIVWGNTSSDNTTGNYDGYNTFAYSCTTPLPSGTGNISANPLFVDAAKGDFRLQKNSPCIDKGNNMYATWEYDLDGKSRIINGTVDMGAYEYMPSVAVTVFFDAQGGSVSPLSKSVTSGLPYGTLPTPTYAMGYTFDGWYTEINGGGKKITEATMVILMSGHILYANWTVGSYTVTFDANGGNPSSQEKAQTYNTQYVLPPAPTRTGHTFTGWFTGVTDGTPITAATTVTDASAHTLYAQWTVNAYTITFDPQGGTVSPSSKPVTWGMPYGDLPAPAKTDWYPAGWWTGVNGTGTQVKPSTMFTDEGNVTLYAYWVDDPTLVSDDPYLSEANDTGTAPLFTTAYDGFIYDTNNTVRGTVTLNAKMSAKKNKDGTVTTNWTFSAKAILQNATVSFSCKTNGVADHLLVSTKGNAETLDVYMQGDRFYGTISGIKVGGAFHVDGAKAVFADKKGVPATVTLPPLMGLYNVALLDGGRLSPAAAASAGYVSLSVGAAGVVKLAGKLSDGTSISGSAKLLKGLNEDGWYAVALYKPLYSKKGFIGGLLWLDPVEKVIRVDTDYEWYVDWVRDVDPKKPGLDFVHELYVLGGYFGNGKGNNALIVPSGMSFSADVPVLPLLVAGGAWREEWYPTGLQVTPKGVGNSLKLELPKGQFLNPSGATLTYTAKTGIFKGSFKLYCGPDAKGKDKAASVSYTGAMVPSGSGALIGLGTGTTTINKVKYGVGVEIAK